jgi:hypothetical protein
MQSRFRFARVETRAQRPLGPRALALVSLVILSAACAETHDRSEERERANEEQAVHEEPESPPGPGVCEEVGRVPIKLENLDTPERYDSIAIRRVLFTSFRAPPPPPDPESWTETKFEILAETGEPCARASSAACAEKVALHPARLVSTSCSQLCLEWSLVTTRGDEVKRWTGPLAVAALLGEIDNVDEALVLVASQGYNLSCPSYDTGELASDYPLQESRTEAREIKGGFEVIATRDQGTCPFILRRVTLRVSPTGTVTEVRHEDFPAGICV